MQFFISDTNIISHHNSLTIEKLNFNERAVSELNEISLLKIT